MCPPKFLLFSHMGLLLFILIFSVVIDNMSGWGEVITYRLIFLLKVLTITIAVDKVFDGKSFLMGKLMMRTKWLDEEWKCDGLEMTKKNGKHSVCARVQV